MKFQSLILLNIFSLCSSSIFAQWGVKGGIDFSSVTLSSGKYQTGFNIGAIYDMKISKRMYFQPGLLFVTNGFSFEINEYVKKAKVNIYALEVPLAMSFRPGIGDNMKLITDFGLYARYGLFGKKKYEYSNNTSMNESPFDVYNRFDMGLNLGLGLSYHDFSLLGAYQLGFTESEKDLKGVEHKKFRISLIYYF
jgi:hypothetical protein